MTSSVLNAFFNIIKCITNIIQPNPLIIYSPKLEFTSNSDDYLQTFQLQLFAIIAQLAEYPTYNREVASPILADSTKRSSIVSVVLQQSSTAKSQDNERTKICTPELTSFCPRNSVG